MGEVIEARAATEMPPPSPELVLIATICLAYLEELPRKRRGPFLRRVSALINLQQNFANVLYIRPRSEDAALADARKQAAEWWRRALQLMVPHV